jgi:imidazolonepropionase-like amidohydrolase
MHPTPRTVLITLPCSGLLTTVLLTVALPALTAPAVAQLPEPPSGQPPLALVGGMLLDGYERPPIHDAAVVIRDGRIVAVGPESEVEIPPDARVIDTGGRTMLPGLIDLHAHMDILGQGEYGEWYEWVLAGDRWPEVMEVSARQTLRAGVTTALDLGAPPVILDVRRRIDTGEIPGPRLLVSLPWITRIAMGGIPLEIQNVIESPEEAARVTRQLIDAGADVIKLWEGLTEEDYDAVVRVAREGGVPVHAHLYEPEAMRMAIRAGVDVIQHAGSGGNPPYDDALVQEIAHRNIPVVQTIAHRIWIYPATIAFPSRLRDARLREDLPPEMYDEVMRSVRDFQRLSYFHGTPREQRYAPVAARQFIDANVLMAMGTDSGTPLNFHTEAAWREISALVDSGMTPLQAISASTKTGAEVLGLARELGTIEPGKRADIIVVDGDPLFDINVLGYVTHVIKDGLVWKEPGDRAGDVVGRR